MKKLVIWAVLLGGAGYGAAKMYLHSEVADSMDTAVLLMSPYADVRYSGVRSTMTGELTIEGIRIKLKDFHDAIEIDRMGIDTPSFLSLIKMTDYVSSRGSSMPDSFGFLVEGLRIPTDADYFDKLYELSAQVRGAPDANDSGATCSGKYGFSPDDLVALGYSEQVISMTINVRNDGNRFGVDLTSSIDDMWDVDAKVTLAGNMKTEVMKGASYRPRLRDLSIDYTDRSLKERVRNYCKKLGLSDEQILAAQMDAFKYYGESNGIEFDAYLLDPYQEFLAGKQRIVITAKPNEPIAMTQIDLYKASDVPALLNLEATAF